MNSKMSDAKYSILDLFHTVKRIADRVPTDFGGGSPLTKIFLMAYMALEFDLRSYVEIGIYRGKSLFPMAYVAKVLEGKAYGIDAYDLETAKEYEVDPSVEGNVNEFLAGLDFAQMYRDVLNLREELEFSDYSEIIKDDSKNAILYFRENHIAIDMLHIDGNHDTQAVQADVDAYVPLVRDGGFIVVDDINWESVRRVYRLLEQKYRVVFSDGYFAIVVKEAHNEPVLPVSRLQFDAVYKLADLFSQVEEKNSMLEGIRIRIAEQERLLTTLVAHTENQGRAIQLLRTKLADGERREKELTGKIDDANQSIQDLTTQATEKENQVLMFANQVQELREQITGKEQYIKYLEALISDIHRSTSWKLTRPVRSVKALLNQARGIERIIAGKSEKKKAHFHPRETTREKKISVIVTSYNHENYISQCLDSILMQKGNFQLEIIVRDDCSTDGTAGIITRYQKSHRKLIKVLPSEINLGVTKNLKRCLGACSGDYIAICEGDDYWLDKYKLQKQLEYLEDHPDYSMCFSSFLFWYEDEKQLTPFETQTQLRKEAITTADLIEENYIGNFSCCMYRAQTIRNLPKEIFDVFTVDWMFNMACGDQGPIGFMPEALSVYRKHRKGTWTGKDEVDQIDTVLLLLDAYNKLLDGKYEADFIKRKDYLIAYKKRLVRIPNLEAIGGEDVYLNTPSTIFNQVTPASGTKSIESALDQTFCIDLLVLDTIFPHPLSPFRYQEFLSYMDYFPSSLVLTTGEHLPAFKETRSIRNIVEVFENENEGYAGRTIVTDHEFNLYTGKLAYAIFLNNIYFFVNALEKKHIPFVFTLYPGGGFALNQPEADTKLSRVFGSPQFRKVIVTQKITYDYLLEKNFCPPEQIEFIYGVVTPLEILKNYDNKKYYGFDKKMLDVCFVAHKYMKGGIDKGYDLFIAAAKRLASGLDNIHFHVVGDFNETDLPIDGLEGKITFYGQRNQSWFEVFYRDKDIIISPNRPFTLLPGTFDGFPTASCTEAGLRNVAIFCTDELKMNIKFTDTKDIVIVPLDVSEIVDRLKYYHEHPAELKAIAENGSSRIREVYSYENQIAPRIRILKNELRTME